MPSHASLQLCYQQESFTQRDNAALTVGDQALSIRARKINFTLHKTDTVFLRKVLNLGYALPQRDAGAWQVSGMDVTPRRPGDPPRGFQRDSQTVFAFYQNGLVREVYHDALSNSKYVY